MRFVTDTSPDIEALQVLAWRHMTPAQKAKLVSSTSRGAHAMAMAGVRTRFPTASPREQFLRLAIVKFGLELARRAYPEIERLALE